MSRSGVQYARADVASYTAGAVVFGDADGELAQTAAMTDGQLLVGKTGLSPVLATLTGTANRVTVTNDAGTITLSGPQDLATGSTPQLLRLGLGVAADGTAKLDILDGSMYLTDTDVNHGMTLFGPTDTYGIFAPLSGTDGGLIINGLSDTDATGIRLAGVIGSTDPTDTTPALVLIGAKKSSTTWTTLGNLETVFVLRNQGTDLMTVLGNGNVGFSTASFGTSADNVLSLANGTAPTTSPADVFQIWSADREGTAGKAGLHLRTEDGTSHVFADLVGIGTTTPGQFIHTVRSGGNNIMQNDMYNTANSPTFISRNARGTLATPTAIPTGDPLAQWNIHGHDGSNFIETASIQFFAEGTIAATRVPSRIAFFTGSDAAPTVMAERWRISSSGILQSNGAQTLQTSTGNLTIATGAGNGNIVLSPNGTGVTQVNNHLQMQNDDLIYRDVNSTLTASTTQTQGQGALTAEINEVSTVANANDTVTLPSAAAGLVITIINNGANTLQIFPASGDNLGAGLDTATTLAAGSNVTYAAYNVTNWESI